MGCLKKIIQFLCNYDSNRIHPVDNIYIESDDYNFYESELNRSRSLNIRNTRRNTGRYNSQENVRGYTDLPMDEIINIINVSESNTNSNSRHVAKSPEIPKKKKVNKTCPICLEKMNLVEKKDKIVCKNKQCRACYHKNCINEWAKTKQTNDVACLLCTLKTIKVKTSIIIPSQQRYNNQSYYNNNYNQYSQNNRYSQYNNRINNRYAIDYSIYDNYRPPNTR